MICLIPARKGSKRIPGKNFKSFLGCPIIKYPIHTAKDSGIFNEIVVMTDEEKFCCEGVTVQQRSNKNAQDNSTLTDIILEFLELRKLRNGILCIMFPTSIWTKKRDLIAGCTSMELGELDCIFSMSKYSHPVQRAFIYDEEKNYFKMATPEYEFLRTQDCFSAYYDAGQFYFIRIESFLKQKKIFMDKLLGHLLFDVIDIDYEEDWKKSEILYAGLYE
jgi:pseudaminic acid cytidylyltransferase